MGLSSKQVSSDGQDWDQSLLQANTSSRDTSPKQQQWLCPTKRQKTNQVQPSDPLNCPRCDSTNTKFCYYNNHNKSQPRYFCKTCKRHWTKGGTLRNVPVGGGRRKKRLIRTPANSSLSTAITSPSATKTIDPNTAPTKSFSSSTITLHERERFDHGFTLPLVDPTSLFGEGGFSDNSNITLKTMNESGMFLDSTALFLPPDPTNAEPLRSPFRDSLTSFDSNTPCFMASAPFQPSTLYRYAGDYSSTTSALAESAVVTDAAGPDETSNFSGSTGRSDGPEQPWITTSTTNTTTVSCGNAVGIPTSNWGWDDIEKFASVDITIPWDDDVEINP